MANMFSSRLILVLVIMQFGCSQHNNFESCLSSSSEDVYFESGEIVLGEMGVYPEELGKKRIKIDAFSISSTEVTNREFSRFVDATGYVTRAERGLTKDIAPDLPEQFLQPGSMVFSPFVKEDINQITQLWEFVPGANWQHPFGPSSNIIGKDAHPVVHVTLEDALAYTKWAHRRLPTEAEWEYAARNGGKNKPTTEITQPSNANTWEGEFPFENSMQDGYKGTAPVGCYQPTPRGLYDMLGNVWELTNSIYYPSHSPNELQAKHPEGTMDGFNNIPVSVIKGGSHLCSKNFCARYREGARQPQDNYLATSHVGFRTVAIN